MPHGQLVTLHDDEILALADDRLGAEPFDPMFDGMYKACPGCDLLVHHSTTDHHTRCAALKALVVWEASEGKY